MRYILYVIAVLLLCSVPAYGQIDSKMDCDDDCVNRALPFLFCDMNTGKRLTKCSQNPNAEPNLRVLKKRLPPWCHNYDKTGLTAIPDGYSFVQINGDDTTIVFASGSVEGMAFTAAIEWWLESGCKPQSDGDDCCINLRWAGDRTDLFGFENNPTGVLAVAYQPIAPSSGAPDCKVNCAEAWIILNSTPEFTKVNENKIPTRFFYNIEEPDGNGSTLEYYHLPSVISHEVGHWYGIGHFGEADSYGQVCGDTRGVCVMSGGENDNGLYAGEEKSITRYDDDLCAFRKLYCCAETATDVAEEREIQHGAFTVYPNPSHSQQLSVSTDQTLLLYSKKVQLVNAQGITVIETVIPIGETLLSLRTDSLPTGVYLIRVSVDALKGSISKKVIIR